MESNVQGPQTRVKRSSGEGKGGRDAEKEGKSQRGSIGRGKRLTSKYGMRKGLKGRKAIMGREMDRTGIWEDWEDADGKYRKGREGTEG